MCGTPEWYPPEGRIEMVGGSRTRYGSETDIWQMGATIPFYMSSPETSGPQHLQTWFLVCFVRQALWRASQWCRCLVLLSGLEEEAIGVQAAQRGGEDRKRQGYAAASDNAWLGRPTVIPSARRPYRSRYIVQSASGIQGTLQRLLRIARTKQRGQNMCVVSKHDIEHPPPTRQPIYSFVKEESPFSHCIVCSK